MQSKCRGFGALLQGQDCFMAVLFKGEATAGTQRLQGSGQTDTDSLFSALGDCF